MLTPFAISMPAISVQTKLCRDFSGSGQIRGSLRLFSILIGFAFSGFAAHGDDDPAQIEFFEKKIRPVLVEHCYQCHSALSKEVKGGLLLDTRESLRRGGESGSAVVPGDPSSSLLLSAIRHDSLQMPPGKQLPESIASDFKVWIETGAVDPRNEPASDSDRLNLAQADLFQQLSQWWSYQPVTSATVPDVQNQTWSEHPIDRFVLSALEKEGLAPADRAAPNVLLRRLSYALTGLPPEARLVRELSESTWDQKWPSLVNELLESPHFGEHWARHWMDVVRYTDTYGYEWDMPAKGSWRYRDYLIRAFNNDLPIDQFIREQIAGDLLKQPRINAQEHINESLIGPMFYQMGEKRHGDSAEFDGIHQEMLDNKIDAFAKAFQAQTIACARCHDHKLDPIHQSEYYALGGMFLSSRWITRTLDTPDRNAETLGKLRELKQQLKTALAAKWSESIPSIVHTLLADQNAAAASPSAAEPGLEDFQRILQKLRSIRNQPEQISGLWEALRLEYQQHSEGRTRQNSDRFEVIADFRNGVPNGWAVDGVGVREVAPCGEFAVLRDGEDAISPLFPGGLLTSSLSPRMNGAVGTPPLRTFQKQFISFEACGGDFSAHRTVVDNAFLTERQVYLKTAMPQWIQLSTFRNMPERNIYIEFATKTSNPNFPPRVGLGGACTDEQIADPASWMGLTRVVLSEEPGVPVDELKRFVSLLSMDAPQTSEAIAERITKWFLDAIVRWSDGTAEPEDVEKINWLLSQKLLSQPVTAADDTAASLLQRYRELEKQLLTPQTVNGMADVDPGINLHLLNRGEYDQPGEVIPRGYLQVLGCSAGGLSQDELRQPDASIPGSGRLRLSELVASNDNPLTARVFVNRVWYWLFNAGIVRTPNDFGHAGDQPSHPELLDYLTARFIQEQWSMKSLIRNILLSETWQQSSSVNSVAADKDPENRLLHHFPLRRLEAEAIRDTILAVSGRLDQSLYGEPTDPWRQSEDPQKRLFRGPLDGLGRRSIYTKMTIMEPPRLLAIFNQPAPKIPTGRRDMTSTPAQSLALLNDPFIIEQARVWAKRLIEEDRSGPDSVETIASETIIADRIHRMFVAAYGRTPENDEVEFWIRTARSLSNMTPAAAVTAEAGQASSSGSGIPRSVLTDEQVWTEMAHLIMNTKELIYIP